VDPTVFSVGRSGEPGDRVSIACVASFEQVKGHRFLVEAFRLLRQRGVLFTSVFVGEGPLRRDVERQIAGHDLGDLIIVRGGCTQAEVVDVLSGSDIVTLASAPTSSGKREGIPVALMEAMAAGRPVVATTTGGVPELVEDRRTGLLAPPADPEALADALETLVRDPLMRRAFGVAGREKVVREFSLHSSAAALAAMFAVSAAAAHTRTAADAQLSQARGALVERAARQATSLPAQR
jgi:glycosyltransferase involved in cell wall biosynthesis